MKTPLKVFEPNILGRDFVIGDLHGAFPVFQNLLANLKFDPAVDRMFSCADLVDRGSESLNCLKLITKEWFHAIFANHEQLMMWAFEEHPLGFNWLRNGGIWGLPALSLAQELLRGETPNEVAEPADYELLELLPAVEELPYMITVNMEDGKKFHIIHAELPFWHGPITDEDLADPERVRELGSIKHDEIEETILWGRYLFADFYKKDLSNYAKMVRTLKYKKSKMIFNDKLSHIISGHTTMRHPVTIVGQTNIDTGAYLAEDPNNTMYSLTCVELKTWKFYRATINDFNEVTPIVINSDDLNDQETP
jgi:hypothetical protein